MRNSVIVAALIAGPALASGGVYDTPLGPAEIVQITDIEKGLRLGETIYALPSDPYLAFIEAQAGDWLLIHLSQGGNACGGQFTWAIAEPEGLTFSPVFGTCSDAYRLEDAQVASAAPVVVNESGAPGQGPVAFSFDGEALTFEHRPLEPIGWSFGMGADFWLDKYLFDFFSAAEVFPRITALLPPEALDEALVNTELGEPFRTEGDWVVGEACMNINCEDNRVAVAISSDGAELIVAVSNEYGPPALFGDAGGGVPATLQDISTPRP